MPDRVMILTAKMGAGHDRVASELARRLTAMGVETELVDVWELVPFGAGQLITGFYKAMIGRFPWLYEGIYRVWLRPGGKSRNRVSPLVRAAGARLNRRVQEANPEVVVSTFHLCSQVLGDLRRRGQLEVTTATLVVDFAAHGLWVDPDIDLHLSLHPSQAERIREHGARAVEVTGPVVGPPFEGRRPERRSARARLGISGSQPVVLVVAGSWGAGRIDATVEALARAGEFRIVVMTGRNDRLYRRMSATGLADVHGWVDDMATFLVAADVVVENAGGLTAMEAMAVGTPVISFNPIPGHGRENVLRMAAAGVSELPCSDGQLVAAVRELAGDGPRRRGLTATARAMFRCDAAEVLANLIPEQQDPVTLPG